jgi:hypothetical protein
MQSHRGHPESSIHLTVERGAKKELDRTPEYLGERISALLVTEVGVADKNRTQETESGKIRY